MIPQTMLGAVEYMIGILNHSNRLTRESPFLIWTESLDSAIYGRRYDGALAFFEDLKSHETTSTHLIPS